MCYPWVRFAVHTAPGHLPKSNSWVKLYLLVKHPRVRYTVNPRALSASTTLLPHSLTVATLNLKLERPCCNNSWERDKETLGLQPVPVTAGYRLGVERSHLGLGLLGLGHWVWVSFKAPVLTRPGLTQPWVAMG